MTKKNTGKIETNSTFFEHHQQRHQMSPSVQSTNNQQTNTTRKGLWAVGALLLATPAASLGIATLCIVFIEGLITNKYSPPPNQQRCADLNSSQFDYGYYLIHPTKHEARVLNDPMPTPIILKVLLLLSSTALIISSALVPPVAALAFLSLLIGSAGFLTSSYDLLLTTFSPEKAIDDEASTDQILTASTSL
ncbi:MAG: hypothetical protein GKR77_01100 [Legionellales bacterium]|nr:hypothetical protein [Legionellales bacterium]